MTTWSITPEEPLDTPQARLKMVKAIEQHLLEALSSGDPEQMLVSCVACTTALAYVLRSDLERQIKTAVPCTCGYGGQHDDANPRCEQNREANR